MNKKEIIKNIRYFFSKIKKEYFLSFTKGCALLMLLLCPVFVMLKQQNFSEKLAKYAYYFLVISVLLMMVEYFFYKNEEKD